MAPFNEDPNAPAGTGEVTSMAADDKTDTVSIPADQYAAYQAYLASQAATTSPLEPVFNMPPPDPATAAQYDAPSKAAATVASGVEPQALPIPVAQAPIPTDTDTLIRDLMARIGILERQAAAAAEAAGIPTNPVEAAWKNLADHLKARASANPAFDFLAKLAKDVQKAYDDVVAGRVVDDKAWGNIKLDVESFADIARNHELTYFPELVRAVDRARLNAS